MRDKTSILFFCVICVAQLHAQSFQLINLNVSDIKSRFIYVGMENRFLVQGFTGAIDVPREQAGYTMHGDTLLLMPVRTGQVNVNFTDKNNTQQVVFIATRLAPPVISIGDQNGNNISRKLISGITPIKIQQTNGLSSGYKIDSIVATINNQTFYLKDNLVSERLSDAIAKAIPGDVLVINSVHAFNAINKNALSMDSPISFRIE